MPPTDAEFEELRSRVERLERQMAEQAGVSSSAAIPPVLPPSPRPGAQPVIKKPKLTISSTAWVAGGGAVIFLIGAIYGLTVSIQRGWISPPVRVGIGLGVGVMLIALAAHRLARVPRGLGIALLASGIGTWSFALYFGSREAGLLPLWLGFSGTLLAVVVAGGLAARTRCDGALAAALATGLVAPLAFSDGSGNLPGLLAHLILLGVAQLAVHYVSRSGANWAWSRLLATLGVWIVAWISVTGGPLPAGASLILELLVLLAAVGLVVAWLPRHPELPWRAGAATAVILIMQALTYWVVWKRAHLPEEWFALTLTGVALLSLALIRPARRRVGNHQHDTVLLLLAVGFALTALPVAVDWRWVGIGWGMLALLIGVAAKLAHREANREANPLILVTGISATAASVLGLTRAWDQPTGDWLMLNPVFTGALMAAGAWAVLVSIPGRHRAISFLAMQFVAVNLVAWEWHRALPVVHSEHTSLALGALLSTLTYAVAGAGQWLRGVIGNSDGEMDRTLRKAGYGWLAVAAGKLLINDLAGTDMLFRAAAALGVGSILLVAAIWADRKRSLRTSV
jgi:hypothetical protein